jgi:hypothetical protein
MKTSKEVLVALARAIKQIDSIQTTDISDLDQFYIDTARQNLLKVLHSNRYELSEKNYRIKQKK